MAAGRWRKFRQEYDRFMDQRGFPIVLGVCVTVIVLSAVITFRQRDALENPPLTAAQEAAAESVGAMQRQQTLAEALIESQSEAEVLTAPTAPPLTFAQPVKGYVSCGFSLETPVYFEKAHAWRIHAAVDIECELGAIVAACAAGTVLSVEDDPQYGLCVRLKHADGYESLYAGLAETEYVRAGDPVAKGQPIGHAGEGVLFEAGPHLHWAVRRNDQPVDPLTLLLAEGT